MRKQYHFRQSSKGYFAWDVERFISFPENFEIKSISLIRLKEVDENYWYGCGSKPTCRSIFDHAKLIYDANLNYPIILSKNGRVMNGMHRVGKAYIQGMKVIRAVQYEIDPEPDYVDVYPDDLSY